MTTNGGRVTLKDVYDAVESLRKEVGNHYVTKDVFQETMRGYDRRISVVEKIAFTTIGIVGVSFLTAAVNFFLRTP